MKFRSHGLHPKKAPLHKKQSIKQDSNIVLETGLEKKLHRDCETAQAEQVTLIRAATQWQFSDWISLSKITFNDIENNEDKGKLSILVAIAWLQLGETSKGKEYITYSLRCGCDKDIVIRLLVSSVYQSLGTIDKALGNSDAGLEKFRQAIEITSPNTDVDLIANIKFNIQNNI